MSFTIPRFKSHFFLGRPTRKEDEPLMSGLDLSFQYSHERGILLQDLDELQVLLISLLDGRHTFDEIVTQLQAHDAAITADDVNAILDDLMSYDVLEEAQVSPPADLTPYDLVRYENQIKFFSVFDATGRQKYEMQARLKRARVTVLGLGGLGSNIVIGLAAMGIGSIRGVDFDTIELSNLSRQVLYDSADIGHHKALAAAEQVRRFNPEIDFEPVQRRIDGPESIIELIKGSDVVVLGADTPSGIGFWMSIAALETGIPFIMGGYSGGMAEIGPFVVPFQTSCMACKPQEPRTDIPETLAWINEAYRQRHPISYVVSAIMANLACSEIMKYLTGIAEPATYNNVFELNIERLTLTPSPRPRSATCGLCGSTVTSSQRYRVLKSMEMSLTG